MGGSDPGHDFAALAWTKSLPSSRRTAWLTFPFYTRKSISRGRDRVLSRADDESINERATLEVQVRNRFLGASRCTGVGLYMGEHNIHSLTACRPRMLRHVLPADMRRTCRSADGRLRSDRHIMEVTKCLPFVSGSWRQAWYRSLA